MARLRVNTLGPFMGLFKLLIDSNTNLTGHTFVVNGTTYTWGTTFAVGVNLGASLDNLLVYVNNPANACAFRAVRQETGGVITNASVILLPAAVGTSLRVSSTSSKHTISEVNYFKVGADPAAPLAFYLPLNKNVVNYRVQIGGGTGDIAWGGNNIVLSFGTGENGQEVALATVAANASTVYELPGGSSTSWTPFASATTPTGFAYLKFVPSVAAMAQTVVIFGELEN